MQVLIFDLFSQSVLLFFLLCVFSGRRITDCDIREKNVTTSNGLGERTNKDARVSPRPQNYSKPISG